MMNGSEKKHFLNTKYNFHSTKYMSMSYFKSNNNKNKYGVIFYALALHSH